MPVPQTYEWEFDIAVERGKLWRFVSDTDRINRLAGLFKIRYEYKPLPSGGSEVHAYARVNGVPIHWIERPSEWVEPEYFVFTRDYHGGPVEQVINRVELHEGSKKGHTRLRHIVQVRPRNFFGAMLARFTVGVQTRKGFARAYGLAEQWASTSDQPIGGTAVSRATKRTELMLRQRLRPASEKLGVEELGKTITQYLLSQPDNEIAELRPYALAKRWNVDKRDLLKFFLLATSDGVFDLHWRVLCPSCRRPKIVQDSLDKLKGMGHCPSCNIDFGVDFDRSIEVTFSPKPVGLGLDAAEYCHFGPGNTPHQLAAWNLKRGEQREVVAQVGALGKHQLVSPRCRGSVFFDVSPSVKETSAIPVYLRPDGISGVPDALPPGRLVLQASNETGDEASLAVVRTAWADDAATAADVTSLQEFRSLFSSQILAPGAEFSIQSMVFLFSDLVGSTQMYERIGDAVAFSLVRDHFDLLREIYTRHNGSLVKTIGDAVMAVFREPQQAVLAAIEMHEKIGSVRDKASGLILSLRIGLHAGPCIAMEANGLLDYFGTTVNMAARVQGTAGAGVVSMSESIVHDPLAASVLKPLQDKLSRQETRLKGLTGEFPIFFLRVADAS